MLFRSGNTAYLGFKLNGLTDKLLIDKLIEASQAGVRIDLVVRGVCCLIGGVPGLTENIHVSSIVGRYLEHARIYIFGTEERRKVYISSADFMTRNTQRRVELACPLLDEAVRRQLAHYIELLCADNVKARELDEAGQWQSVSRPSGQTPRDAQNILLAEAAESPALAGKEAEPSPPAFLPWLRQKLGWD